VVGVGGPENRVKENPGNRLSFLFNYP